MSRDDHVIYTSTDSPPYYIYDRAWDDLRVPLSTLNQAGVKAPDFVKYADDGAGSTGVFGYAFSPTAEEEVFLEAQLPHGYAENTEIQPHLHISTPPGTGTDGDVVFGLEYIISNVDGTWPSTTTTTTATRTITAATDDGKQLIAGFEPDINEDGSLNLEVSCMIIGRLYRDATNVADTYAGDVFIWEIDFHFAKSSNGTAEPFAGKGPIGEPG